MSKKQSYITIQLTYKQ